VILLSHEQVQELRPWFLPERPGPLIGLHLLQTGHGACFADRWPAPEALLVYTTDNYSLLGNPDALTPDDLREHIAGFVEAPPEFLPLLGAAFADVQRWDRVILELRGEPATSPPVDAEVRRLALDDTVHLWGLSPESAWISKSWGGHAGLAASGRAWGAFVGGRLAAVAATFFQGERYEEIGVVTEPAFRGRGLSVACTRNLVMDILARGGWASWTTSPDNRASLRVAEKLGFQFVRNDYLYVAGMPTPRPAQRDSGDGSG
jgi:RimJ/RimL family protein N-acetyltransferase